MCVVYRAVISFHKIMGQILVSCCVSLESSEGKESLSERNFGSRAVCAVLVAPFSGWFQQQSCIVVWRKSDSIVSSSDTLLDTLIIPARIR